MGMFDFNRNGRLDIADYALFEHLRSRWEEQEKEEQRSEERRKEEVMDLICGGDDESGLREFDVDDFEADDFLDGEFDDDSFEDDDPDEYSDENDFDDDLDEDDLSDYDPESDPYSYLNLVESVTPNESDLAGARRIARHMRVNVKEPTRNGLSCLECAFWGSTTPGLARGCGCNIWYVVQIEYGGSIEDCDPRLDDETCGHFQEGTGTPARCYDCVWWRKGKLDVSRSQGCGHWDACIAKENALRDDIHRRFGGNVDFFVFESDFPYVDERICPEFSLDRTLEAGYGYACAEGVKALRSHQRDLQACEATDDAVQFRAQVTGIAHCGRKSIWKKAKELGVCDVKLVPEPQNAYDENAIAVYVGGKHGGYLPAKIAKKVRKLLDSGMDASIVSHHIHVRHSKRDDGSDWVSVDVTVKCEPGGGSACADDDAASLPSSASDSSGKGLPTSGCSGERSGGETYFLTPDVLEAIDSPDSEVLSKLRDAPRP
jgi:hypothetical protein